MSIVLLNRGEVKSFVQKLLDKKIKKKEEIMTGFYLLADNLSLYT
jgi:hypothetical protein